MKQSAFALARPSSRLGPDHIRRADISELDRTTFN
jgi:hypothetical protein